MTKLTRRELQILRQIVEDHIDSEIVSGSEAGRDTGRRILAKLNAASFVVAEEQTENLSTFEIAKQADSQLKLLCQLYQKRRGQTS